MDDVITRRVEALAITKGFGISDIQFFQPNRVSGAPITFLPPLSFQPFELSCTKASRNRHVEERVEVNASEHYGDETLPKGSLSGILGDNGSRDTVWSWSALRGLDSQGLCEG